MRLESIGMGKPVSFKDLPNGMRYYGRFDHVANASGIGVKCGSMHTPLGKTGLPHLVEHELCRSTKGYTVKEVELILRRYLGDGDADWNVRIDRYSTFFGHLMLLRSSHMRACFDIFANMLRDRVINQEGHATEQSRVINEYYLRGVDVMEALLDDALHMEIYKANPARYRVDCLPNELQSVSVRDVFTFIRKQCVPRNMFMIVLGPRFKVAERMAYKYFSDWPDLSVPEPVFDPSKYQERILEHKIYTIERPGIGQDHIILGFSIDEFGGRNHYVLRVLMNILNNHLLVEKLQEHSKGVYRSPVSISQSKYHGLLTISFATKDRDFVQEGIDRVIEVCKYLRESLIDPEIFRSALYRTFYEYISPFVTDANQLLEMIIDSAANGDEDLVVLHSGKQELEKVTRDKIRSLANQFLTDKFVVVHIKPA